MTWCSGSYVGLVIEGTMAQLSIWIPLCNNLGRIVKSSVLCWRPEITEAQMMEGFYNMVDRYNEQKRQLRNRRPWVDSAKKPGVPPSVMTVTHVNQTKDLYVCCVITLWYILIYYSQGLATFYPFRSLLLSCQHSRTTVEVCYAPYLFINSY